MKTELQNILIKEYQTWKNSKQMEALIHYMSGSGKKHMLKLSDL